MLSHTRMGVPYEYTHMGRPIRVWDNIRIWGRTGKVSAGNSGHFSLICSFSFSRTDLIQIQGIYGKVSYVVSTIKISSRYLHPCRSYRP